MRKHPRSLDFKYRVLSRGSSPLKLSNLYTLTVNNHKVTVINQTERVGTIKEYQSMKLLIDSSSVEVFINGGELVFTDRVYFKDTPVLSLNKKMTYRITTLSK